MIKALHIATLLLFLLCCGCQTSTSHQVLALPVYIYQNYPPFIINASTQNGLSYDWITAINRHLKQIQLKAAVIDRPSLNSKLQHGEPALILWASLYWFGDFNDIQGSQPILWDSDLLVSSATSPIKNKTQLAGKKFCAIQGHKYVALDPWLSNGSLTRVDRTSYHQCLEMIKLHQADVTQIDKSTSLYLLSDKARAELNIMPTPTAAFARRLLASKTYHPLLPEINAAIRALNQDEQWKNKLKAYGSQDFVNLFDLYSEDVKELQIDSK